MISLLAVPAYANVGSQISTFLSNIQFNASSKLVEFLIFFTIFTSLAMLGLNKFISGEYNKSGSSAAKALAVGLGAAMTIAIINYSTFSLGIFYPFAKNLIFFMGVLTIFIILTKYVGMQSKFFAFILSLITAWLLFNAMTCVIDDAKGTTACSPSVVWENAISWFTPGGSKNSENGESSESGESGDEEGEEITKGFLAESKLQWELFKLKSEYLVRSSSGDPEAYMKNITADIDNLKEKLGKGYSESIKKSIQKTITALEKKRADAQKKLKKEDTCEGKYEKAMDEKSSWSDLLNLFSEPDLSGLKMILIIEERM